MRLGFSRARWFALALALFSCEKPPVPGHAASAASGGTPAAAPHAALSEHPATPLSARPSAEASSGATASEREANTTITGCLASESGQGEAPTRAGASRPSVEIIPGADPTKPKIVHHLAHACCLRARTRIAQTANTVTLIEELYGTPCRCQCASTLSTELVLKPGEYELRVKTVQRENESEAFQGNLHVAASTAPAAAAPEPRLPKTIHVPPASH
jgi:hypothetical protein